MTTHEFQHYAEIAYDIIGAAMVVHQELHSGIAEAVYSESLCIELQEMGYQVQHEVDVPVYYKGRLLKKRYRMDVLVEDDIIIEVKATDELLSEHRAQLYNYLRLTQKPVGILVNFGKSVTAEKYYFDKVSNKIDYLRRM